MKIRIVGGSKLLSCQFCLKDAPWMLTLESDRTGAVVCLCQHCADYLAHACNSSVWHPLPKEENVAKPPLTGVFEGGCMNGEPYTVPAPYPEFLEYKTGECKIIGGPEGGQTVWFVDRYGYSQRYGKYVLVK